MGALLILLGETAAHSIDWNPFATIVGAIIGGIAGLIVGRWTIDESKKTERLKAAAAYLRAIADALSKIADAIVADIRPTEPGHEFELLVVGYERYLGPYLGSAFSEFDADVHRLQDLVQRLRAKDYPSLYEPNKDKRGDLVGDMRGIAGNMRAKISKLLL